MRLAPVLLLACLATRADAACPSFADGFEAVPAVRPPITVDTSGGYRIVVDGHTITVTDPARRNSVQHWGEGAHENLNGKHIKDWGGAAGWDGARRTLELGDGTKVTMQVVAPGDVTMTTAIYDGVHHVLIDNCRTAVALRTSDAAQTAQRDAAEHDGEIARFLTHPSTEAATYENLGNEDASFQFAPGPQPLGATGGEANPNQVNDFFDDPRLGHT